MSKLYSYTQGDVSSLPIIDGERTMVVQFEGGY